jgi:streptogramin lyase
MKAKTIIALLAVMSLAGSVFPGGNSIPKYPGVTVRTLVKGAPIHGSNGLYFGPDGYLYVASAGGNEIIKMDTNSGRILDRIGAERGVVTPDDLTFGPDGMLYFTAIMIGEVRKIDPLDRAATASTIATGLPGVNPITFNDHGRLFVALDFFGFAGLYELDPNGVQPPHLIYDGWDVYNLNGFDFGPDGCLYGPIYGQGVVKIDVDAPAIVPLISGIAPSAVKFDSQGRLYTDDNNTGQVLRYDYGDWGNGHLLGTVPFDMDNLAIDSRNQVYVSADADGCIAKILPNGKYILLSPGGMIAPNGVAVMPRGDGGESVYVGDLFSLREFDGLTGKARSVAPAGILSGGLTTFLGTLAPDGNNLVVSSAATYVVQTWDPINGVAPESHRNFNIPMDAIRFGGDLVATEAMTGQVVRWTSGGWVNLLNYRLGVPVGLAANGSDLYVADYFLGMVFKVNPDGTSVPVAIGLSGPTGLAYYPPDGSLLVVEANAGQLERIDPATHTVTTLAEGLQLGYASGFINGVAVGPSGAIYVAGNNADVLYRIEIHR